MNNEYARVRELLQQLADDVQQCKFANREQKLWALGYVIGMADSLSTLNLPPWAPPLTPRMPGVPVNRVEERT